MELGVRNEHSLAVRLAPWQGESIKSLLMRLATANACKYTALVKFLGFSANSRFTPGSASESDMYAELSRVLNVTEDTLLDVLRTPAMKDLWVPSVKGTSEMKIRSIRVCVSCLFEAPYHRQAWQHALYCVCNKHQELLIDVCPQCGEYLELDVSHNGRCAKCASHIAAWQVCKTEVPQWQHQSLQGAPSRELLISLLQMSMIAVRPLDLFTTDIRVREMRVAEVMKLMQKAWVLLHSDTARLALKEALSGRWGEVSQILGEELPFTLYREVTALALTNDIASDGELESLIFKDESRALDIIKSTKRFAILCEGEPALGLVKGSQLMGCLGVTTRAFEQLKQAGVFNQVNPRAAKKDALYSLEGVAVQVSKLAGVDSVDGDYVLYGEFVPSACKFISGLDEGKVLVDIFNHCLPVKLPSSQQGTLVERLYVHKNSFCERYKECDIYDYKTVPVTFLPAFFGTKMPNVRALLQSEFIQDVIGFNALRVNDDIPTFALKAFQDNYLILNKWAYSHNKSKTKSLCALKRAKVEPLVRVSEEYCNSFEIFPKSAEQILLDRYDELSPDYHGKKRRRKK